MPPSEPRSHKIRPDERGYLPPVHLGPVFFGDRRVVFTEDVSDVVLPAAPLLGGEGAVCGDVPVVERRLSYRTALLSGEEVLWLMVASRPVEGVLELPLVASVDVVEPLRDVLEALLCLPLHHLAFIGEGEQSMYAAASSDSGG